MPRRQATFRYYAHRQGKPSSSRRTDEALRPFGSKRSCICSCHDDDMTNQFALPATRNRSAVELDNTGQGICVLAHHQELLQGLAQVRQTSSRTDPPRCPAGQHMTTKKTLLRPETTRPGPELKRSADLHLQCEVVAALLEGLAEIHPTDSRCYLSARGSRIAAGEPCACRSRTQHCLRTRSLPRQGPLPCCSSCTGRMGWSHPRSRNSLPMQDECYE